MENSGCYSLGVIPISAAATVVTTATTALDGMASATFEVSLAYGSGGTKIQAYIETCIDGNTWIDIACVTFTTGGGSKIVNLSGLTPKTTAISPTDGALPDDTCVDGVLGNQLRVKVISTGVYAGNTVLSVSAAVR